MDPDITSRECKGHLKPITTPIKPLPCLLRVSLLILPGPHLLLGPSHLYIMPNQLLIHFTPTLNHSLSGMHLIRGGDPSTIILLFLFLHHLLNHNHRLLLHQGSPKCLLNQTRTQIIGRLSKYIVGNHLPNHNPIHVHLKYTPPLNYPYHHFQTRTLE